jgi:hypothetical protein
MVLKFSQGQQGACMLGWMYQVSLKGKKSNRLSRQRTSLSILF